MSLFLSFLLSFKRYPKKITNKSRRKNRKKKRNSIKCQVVRKQKVTRVVSFSPDLKRFGYFFFFLFGTVPFFPFSFHDIRKSRVVCNRKTVEKGKGQKKIHIHPFNEQVSSIFLLFKKNCIYTLYFPFIIISVCNFTREQTKVRVWFVSLNDTFFSLFPDFYCCATIERRKNTWKCGGRIEEL
jgi:hypothetical protein